MERRTPGIRWTGSLVGSRAVLDLFFGTKPVVPAGNPKAIPLLSHYASTFFDFKFSERWNLHVASSEYWSRAVWYSGRCEGSAYTVNRKIYIYIKSLGILNRYVWKLTCSFERSSFNITTLVGWESNLNCFLFLASVYSLLSIWSSSRQLLEKVQHLNMPGTSKSLLVPAT